MNIAINGFGRIGRMILRAAIENDAEINIINDPSLICSAYAAYLFKHDSSQGRYFGKVCYDEKHLIVNRMKIRLFHEKDPKNVPWKECGGDWVIDASGKFRNCDRAQQFIEAGATKVIISAPSEDAPMYIVGVNLDKFNHEDKVVSMASCTTNCLAPIIKVLHERFAIDEALMTTIHSVTNSQVLIDGARPHKWRFGRGGIQNIIPSTTGAAKAIGKIIPDLNGKITGLAFRVPTPIVSVIDLTVKLCTCTDYYGIKCAMRDAASCRLKGILGYTEEEVVSSDFIGCKCSSIFDAGAGIQLNEKFFKLIAWYDNEVGYANRIIDFIKFIQDSDSSPKPICVPASLTPCPRPCPEDNVPKCPPPCPPPPPCPCPPKPPCPPPCPPPPPCCPQPPPRPPCNKSPPPPTNAPATTCKKNKCPKKDQCKKKKPKKDNTCKSNKC